VVTIQKAPTAAKECTNKPALFRFRAIVGYGPHNAANMPAASWATAAYSKASLTSSAPALGTSAWGG
jgi:transketolase